ncbi:hypothetical protein [Sphingobacterium corticibacter]|uniref:Uncharacterized protein n=1 Tax=Sphingobacterium corticibacter TaxID=2171749 RepID=A0A2T8HLF5_9SPHI|nr:hypothetical protein [Sphingobacterium corticibacter]PVH26256.1 hypothetical protein DC487_01125 [Sphingobacterium corticibacter]
MHNFYITPTLIDSFLFLQSNGFQPDDFQEFINRINKVKTSQDDSAKKGVAFESCVNLTLSGNPTSDLDGFSFDPELVNKIVSKLFDYTGMQVWIDADVDFSYGVFKVGGFADYTQPFKITDLKTTSNYKLGKYTNYSQHKAFGLIDPNIKRFDYLITDFENVYLEPYINKKAYHEEFISNVEMFYLFCKEHSHLISDTKIWGNG